MPVSGEMDFGGRLERTIQSIGDALKNSNWETSLRVNVSTGSAAGGVSGSADAMLDRAEAAGRAASAQFWAGGSTGAAAPGSDFWMGGPGVPAGGGAKDLGALLDSNNPQGVVTGLSRMADAIDDLIDRMEGRSRGGRRKGGGVPTGGGHGTAAPEAGQPLVPGDGGYGYMSPWSAFSLIRSPMGAIQSMALQAASGEGGALSSLAQGGLMGWMAGKQGFSLGKALLAPVGEGSWLSAGGTAALGGAALAGGAYAGWQINNNSAEGVLKDSMEEVADWRMSRRLGTRFDFREQAMASAFQSRRDVVWPEVREFLSQLNVGTDRWNTTGGGSSLEGYRDWVKFADDATARGMHMGLGAGETAGIVGAAMRSGLLDPRASGPGGRSYADPLDLLNQIHGAIVKGHEVGVSTGETLQVIARLNQQMVDAGGGVDKGTFRWMLGLQQAIQDGGGADRPELRGTQAANVGRVFTETNRGDASRVMAMREFLTVDESGRQVLTPEALKLANEMLGEGAVADIRNTYANGDIRVAEALINRPGGMGRAQAGMVKRLADRGLKGEAIGYITGMPQTDPVFMSAAIQAAKRGIKGVGIVGANVGGEETGRDEIRRARSLMGVGTVYTKKSGRLPETAEAIFEVNKDALNGFRESVRFADRALRVFGNTVRGNAKGDAASGAMLVLSPGVLIASQLFH